MKDDVELDDTASTAKANEVASTDEADEVIEADQADKVDGTNQDASPKPDWLNACVRVLPHLNASSRRESVQFAVQRWYVGTRLYVC